MFAKRSASKDHSRVGIAIRVMGLFCSSNWFLLFFLDVHVEECFTVNIYLLTDYHNDSSEFSFFSAVEKLGCCLCKIHQPYKCCIIIGDSNCNLFDEWSLPSST